MTLENQVNMIERALGERMLLHAFGVLRIWLDELDMPHYKDRMLTLEDSYNHVFDYYLSADDPQRDKLLDRLATDAYRLCDEVYAEIRLHRGISPRMVGFNPTNSQSVVQYFSACLKLTETDYNFLEQTLSNQEQQALSLVLITALSKNIRECFNERLIYILISAISSPDDLVAQQASINTLFLLAHYDVRIDYFPDIQDAFINAIGDGDLAFLAMLAYIELCRPILPQSHRLSSVEAVDEMLKLMRTPGEERNIQQTFVTILPETEKGYIQGVVNILPETWVYDVIVGENEQRQRDVEECYLHIGKLEYMLNRLPEAEKWLVNRLREKNPTAREYINYGHCCLLRGDRMMAYEAYMQARELCENYNEFYTFFRPDRNLLVERGIPLEQIYLIEDQILRSR